LGRRHGLSYAGSRLAPLEIRSEHPELSGEHQTRARRDGQQLPASGSGDQAGQSEDEAETGERQQYVSAPAQMLARWRIRTRTPLDMPKHPAERNPAITASGRSS
jgi:hypothetical protein